MESSPAYPQPENYGDQPEIEVKTSYLGKANIDIPPTNGDSNVVYLEDRMSTGFRVPRIMSAPESLTNPQAIIDFYFPEENGAQVEQITQFACNLELDILASPYKIPKNLSRAMVLLLKYKNALKDNNIESQNEEIINKIDRTLGVYVDKSTPQIIGIVSNLSRNIQNYSLDVSDLVTLGQIGLIEGLSSFDLSVSEKYDPSSWCYFRIKGEAYDAIRKHGRMIRAPKSDIKNIESLRQKKTDGEELTEKEELKLQNILYKLDRSDVRSLDEPYYMTDGNSKFEQFIEVREVEEEQIDLPDINVDQLIANLEERHQKIIKMRFGFPPYDNKNEGKGYTEPEIAKELGITYSRVSQLISYKIMPRLEKLSGAAEKEEYDPSENPLSEREVQLLELIALGKPMQEISDDLSITEHTIKSHLRHIYKKLGAQTRPQAIAVAYENNLLSGVNDNSQDAANLSDRQLEILKKIADGYTKSEIAHELYLSLNTVKVHVKDILKLLNVKSSTHAVFKLCEAGLLDH